MNKIFVTTMFVITHATYNVFVFGQGPFQSKLPYIFYGKNIDIYKYDLDFI